MSHMPAGMVRTGKNMAATITAAPGSPSPPIFFVTIYAFMADGTETKTKAVAICSELNPSHVMGMTNASGVMTTLYKEPAILHPTWPTKDWSIILHFDKQYPTIITRNTGITD